MLFRSLRPSSPRGGPVRHRPHPPPPDPASRRPSFRDCGPVCRRPGFPRIPPRGNRGAARNPPPSLQAQAQMKLSLTYAANGDNYEAIERCLKSATPHRPNPHPPLPPAPPRSTPAAAILIPMSLALAIYPDPG